jgi:hypothetical protein
VLRTQDLNPLLAAETLDVGREVDPFNDPEVVRLTAMNIELAVKNLIQSKNAPDCLVITAELCGYSLQAMPTEGGEIKVLVFEK